MVVQSTSSVKKRPKSPLDSRASPYSRNTRSVVSVDMSSHLIEPMNGEADGPTDNNIGTDEAVDQRPAADRAARPCALTRGRGQGELPRTFLQVSGWIGRDAAAWLG